MIQEMLLTDWCTNLSLLTSYLLHGAEFFLSSWPILS